MLWWLAVFYWHGMGYKIATSLLILSFELREWFQIPGFMSWITWVEAMANYLSSFSALCYRTFNGVTWCLMQQWLVNSDHKNQQWQKSQNLNLRGVTNFCSALQLNHFFSGHLYACVFKIPSNAAGERVRVCQGMVWLYLVVSHCQVFQGVESCRKFPWANKAPVFPQLGGSNMIQVDIDPDCLHFIVSNQAALCCGLVPVYHLGSADPCIPKRQWENTVIWIGVSFCPNKMSEVHMLFWTWICYTWKKQKLIPNDGL